MVENNILPEDQFQKLTPDDEAFIEKMREYHTSTSPVHGVLEEYVEAGEGFYWSVYDSHDGYHVMDEGDRLVIYNPDGTIRFDGILITDRESGRYPINDNLPTGPMRQVCLGLWVHWIPKGLSSNQWAEIFFGGRNLRADLYQVQNS